MGENSNIRLFSNLEKHILRRRVVNSNPIGMCEVWLDRELTSASIECPNRKIGHIQPELQRLFENSVVSQIRSSAGRKARIDLGPLAFDLWSKSRE